MKGKYLVLIGCILFSGSLFNTGVLAAKTFSERYEELIEDGVLDITV